MRIPVVDIVGQYQQSFDAWTAAASYPELLQDGFLLRAGESQSPQLLQFNLKEKRLDAVDWPDDFASLRNAAAHAVPGRPMPRFSAESIPAIVIPLDTPRPESGPRRPPQPNDGGRRGLGGRGPRPPGFRGFNRGQGERGERRGPPPQQQPPPQPPPPPPPVRAPDADRWIVLRLNREVFQQKFLAQLTARWFTVTGDIAYDILIMESRTKKCGL